MEGVQNEDEGVQGGPWKTHTPVGCSVWVDGRDDDTVSLLEGEVGWAVNLNLSIDWPGPWNSGEGNPFLDKEWRPLADPLSKGEKRNNLVDTSYLLNRPINITPVPKL